MAATSHPFNCKREIKGALPGDNGSFRGGRVVYVEIIEPVTELYSLVGLGRRRRAGIAGRDHPGQLGLLRSVSWLAGRRALRKPRYLVVARRRDFLPPRRIVPADWRGSWRRPRPAVPDRLAGFWRLRRPRGFCRARWSRRPIGLARPYLALVGRRALRKPRYLLLHCAEIFCRRAGLFLQTGEALGGGRGLLFQTA